MVSRAIAQCAAVDLSQAGEHHHVFPERLERLHRRRDLEVRAYRLRYPLVLNHADRMVDKAEPDDGFRGAGNGQRRDH